MLTEFNGAKAAVFIGPDLLVYLRDDTAGLPFAGHWDFPGGGREGQETPEETLIREVHEEFALVLASADLGWRRMYQDGRDPSHKFWFFVVHLPRDAAQNIVFGTEGQYWRLMPPEQVLALPDLVPVLGARFRQWLQETGGDPI